MRGCNYSLRSMLRRMRRFRAGGRPAFHNRAPSSRIRLDANAVIGRLIESAACRQGSVQSFAPKRALKGIGSAPTRLPMRGRAETSPSQTVGRQLRHSDALGGLLHDVPNRLYRHPISPRPSYLIDPAEHLSSIKLRLRPAARLGSHPIGAKAHGLALRLTSSQSGMPSFSTPLTRRILAANRC